VLTPQRAAGALEGQPGDRLLLRLRVGEYSRWNVRAAPTTASEVVGVKRDGELITVDSREGDWVCLHDDTGWVRVNQGTGAWLPVTLCSERVPVLRTEEIELIGVEGNDPVRVIVRSQSAVVHLTVEYLTGRPPACSLVAEGIEWDMGRGLTFSGTGLSIFLQWESVPAVLGAISALFPGQGLPRPGDPVAVARWIDEASAAAERNEAIATLHAAQSSEGMAVFTGVELIRQVEHPPWECRSPSPPSGEGAGLERELRLRLQRFFMFYRPEKLPSVVPTLLAAHGDDEEIFRKLVAKYGPEPSRNLSELPLRPGWREEENSLGDIFYVHVGGSKQWTRPSEYFLDSTVQPAP